MLQDGCVYYTTSATCSYNSSSWDCSYYEDYYDGDTWAGYSLNDCEESSTDDCNFDTIVVDSTSGASHVIAAASAAAAVLGAIALL